ncbi:MAG: RT0821/Lpp0805 family surface protein [Proteobacteria bacterium]|nr:RT0821/Lpp0805 family surface protein [Pseudomonadota bacterium]
MKKIVPLIVLIFALAACSEGQGNKQTGGTLLGAGLGALAGSQIGGGRGQLVAVAVGALGGAFLGSEIGKSLDKADRAAIANTTHEALETGQSGQPVTWRNPDSGHYGSVTPQPAVQTGSGEYCREYTQTSRPSPTTQPAHGRACRQPDGTWKIVN